MHDIISMAVLQGAPDLSGEFPRNAFAKASMADDVVEHLTAIDVLEDHVVVVVMDDHLAHSADVRMVKQETKGCFTERSHFLGVVFCRLGCKKGLGRRWGGGISASRRRWYRTRHDFNSELNIECKCQPQAFVLEHAHKK